jgi:hypothetical protein
MTNPEDIHEQYAKVIKHLIEKQLSDEMPDLDKELIVIEIQNRYKKLVQEYFNIEKS